MGRTDRTVLDLTGPTTNNRTLLCIAVGQPAQAGFLMASPAFSTLGLDWRNI